MQAIFWTPLFSVYFQRFSELLHKQVLAKTNVLNSTHVWLDFTFLQFGRQITAIQVSFVHAARLNESSFQSSVGSNSATSKKAVLRTKSSKSLEHHHRFFFHRLFGQRIQTPKKFAILFYIPVYPFSATLFTENIIVLTLKLTYARLCGNRCPMYY